MKKIITTIAFVGLTAISLSSCTSRQGGTFVGGAAGAGLGYAVTGGSAVGAAIGAGTGAVIGNNIGREQRYRDYRHGYRYGVHNRTYYH